MSANPPSAQTTVQQTQKAVHLTDVLQDSSRQLYHLVSGGGYQDAVLVIKRIYGTLEELRLVIDSLLGPGPSNRWQGIPQASSGGGGWAFLAGLIIGAAIGYFLL